MLSVEISFKTVNIFKFKKEKKTCLYRNCKRNDCDNIYKTLRINYWNFKIFF